MITHLARRLRLRRRCLARFATDSSGNVAVLFAVSLVVLMLAIGAAVDIGRWLHAREQTIAAVDAALLAGGRYLQTNNNDQTGAIAAAQKYYAQNVTTRLPVMNDTVSFAVADNGTAMTASGTAYIKTPFLQFANIDKLPLISTAQTQFSKAKLAAGGNAKSNIEVALILDVTGSMAGQKIADLKAAATDLVDITVWEDQSGHYSKVALIPYSMAVNVGNYAERVRGNYTAGKTCSNPGCEKFKFTNAFGAKKTFSISTCVSERTGDDAYSEEPPSSKLLGYNYPAPTNPCLSNTIIPLTDEKQTLKNAIADLQASGSTAGHIGVAWGWYLLSPKFAYLWPGKSAPAPYSDLTVTDAEGNPKLKKIAILMTDGEYNSAYCHGVISKDSTSGSGNMADHINCNASNGHSFDQAVKLCTNMKKTGITVYTVGFEVVDDQRARDLMTTCATDSSKVYMADNGEQLKQAFRDIALKLSALYLSK